MGCESEGSAGFVIAPAPSCRGQPAEQVEENNQNWDPNDQPEAALRSRQHDGHRSALGQSVDGDRVAIPGDSKCLDVHHTEHLDLQAFGLSVL